jgi:hypothetical protein
LEEEGLGCHRHSSCRGRVERGKIVWMEFSHKISAPSTRKYGSIAFSRGKIMFTIVTNFFFFFKNAVKEERRQAGAAEAIRRITKKSHVLESLGTQLI